MHQKGEVLKSDKNCFKRAPKSNGKNPDIFLNDGSWSYQCGAD